MSRRPASMKFYGDRLAEIRRFRGYTQAELASQVGISREMIRQYEGGLKYPSKFVLARISRELDMPVQYFTEPLRLQVGDETPVFFRKLKRTPAHVRDTLTVYQLWLEHVYSYLEEYVKFPEGQALWSIFQGDPREPISHDEIETCANETRKALGIGLGPISNVMLLLEKNGIVIGRAPKVSPDVDACSRRKGQKAFVLLGLSKTAVRHRYDAAHELGHLVLHHQISLTDIAMNPAISERLEAEAYYFAGAFLLPRVSFVKEFVALDFNSLVRLKSRWKVSIAALGQRAHELGLVDDSEFKRFQVGRSARGWGLREPLDQELPSETPSMLGKAVKLLLSQGILSKGDLIRNLGLPPRDVFRLLNVPETEFIEPTPTVSVIPLRGPKV